MIIIDYSGIVMAAIHTDLKNKRDINADFIRHLILNKIRMYNKKYRAEYGEMVLVLDCTHGAGNSNWRYDYFKHYKANRKKAREASKLDWNAIFDIIAEITAEIKKYFPYKILQVPHTEADDIIGWICEFKEIFEPVMIVSGDKDFRQLQRYKGVKQFSPIVKKLLVEPKPLMYIKEHTIRGDVSDGVPNVLSPENQFVATNPRQKSITEKLLTEWMMKPVAQICLGNPELAKRFETNAKMIDLSLLPQKYKDLISEDFDKPIIGKANRLYSFFIKKRMRIMLDSLDEFLPLKG